MRRTGISREFLPTLTEWMKQLDTVLQKAGTAPLDFTLHDADHALRVAQRVEQLLPPTTRRNLSDYELALLLLSAYGHDIGMSPERKKVSQHYRHLFGMGAAARSMRWCRRLRAYPVYLAALPVPERSRRDGRATGLEPRSGSP